MGIALVGEYVNTGTVTAKSTETSTAVTDDDPSGYIGTRVAEVEDVIEERQLTEVLGSEAQRQVDDDRPAPTPRDPDLPRTGAPIMILAWVSVCLIGAGLYLQRIARPHDP